MSTLRFTRGVHDMSEWTDWVACNRLEDSGFTGTAWTDLSNAQVDNANFAYAIASNDGAWNNSITEITQTFTDNLAAIIPTNATLNTIETRFHFDNPNQLFFINQLNVYRSNSFGDLVENIGFVDGQTIGPKQITYTDTSPSSNIISGATGSMYMKCTHTGAEGAGYFWQLNLRYVDIRVEFTRAPNVPRTAFVATF